MPNETDYLEFLTGQRQTREFTDEPVSEADIQSLLEVMRWTGSAKNQQPWQFLVVREPSIIGRLAEATEFTGWIVNAPLLLIVLTEGPDRFAHRYDLGRVDERILLASQALGLGAGIVTFWSDSAQALARDALALPADWSIYSAVAVGHPTASATPARLGGRKPLDELVNWTGSGIGSVQEQHSSVPVACAGAHRMPLPFRRAACGHARVTPLRVAQIEDRLDRAVLAAGEADLHGLLPLV